MAAPITTSATTLEGQALEILTALQQAEQSASTADIQYDNVNVTFDTDQSFASVTAQIPVSLLLVAGSPKFDATAYLP